MKFILIEYIEKALSQAHIEYDISVRQWVAWIDGLPGVYAQGKGRREVREELASVLEEHILLALRDGKRISGFGLSQNIHAKAA